jgi:DGQHR domain-containing protein
MKAIIIQQVKNKLVLISAIKFKELNQIVRFTNREASVWDPYDFDSTYSNDTEYYQRLVDSERVKEIELFIKETFVEQEKNQDSIATIFPSSMILAFESENTNIDNQEFISFDLPSNNDSCLIVDGQHRFAAMQRLYNRYKHEQFESLNTSFIKKIENYSFNCTVLLNFDIWEQAQLFINVNFNQKKVNKSLYYDIFGAVPPENKVDKNSGIYLSHRLAQFLNNSEKSPLKNFIKMLGTGPGYFSQAFLVESLLVHFGSRGVWSSIEKDYRSKGTMHEILPKIFVAYFTAIKDTFKDNWPKGDSKYDSILCKTTGMGALIRLLGYIYKQLSIGAYPRIDKIDFENISTDDLTKVFKTIFEPISKKNQILFGNKGEYGGTGGAGLQSKLYKRLGQELGLFSADK